MTRLSLPSLTALALIALAAGCQDPAEVGAGLLDDPDGVAVTDTTTILTATALLDSVSTQGAERYLVGEYDDDVLGRVSATAYLQLGLGGQTFDVDEAADVDSLVLELPLGYRYGDPDAPVTVSVHRVTAPIEAAEDGGALFNSDAFAYDPVPLATAVVEPGADSVDVRLSGPLGQELLDMVLGDDVTDDAFQDALRGLALVADGAAAVLGVEPSSTDSVALRLYYDLDPSDPDDQASIAFVLADGSFSHVEGDAGGPLAAFPETRSSVTSARTGARTFVQSGVGLVTRLDMPGLFRTLYSARQYAIHNATLSLYPVDGTYDEETPLPDRLALYVADEDNRNVTALTTSGGSTVTATPSGGDEFGRGVRYRFDVTQFVTDEIRAGYETGRVLIVLPETATYAGSVSRVVLGGREDRAYRPSLSVVYSSF